MKRVRSLVFHTLDFPDLKAFKDELLNTVSSYRFSEKSGYGLSLLDFSDDVLLVKVIKRTSTFINDYDDSANEFVKKQIFVFADFRFVVDLSLKMLYVLGGLSQINFVKYIFRENFKTDYDLNPVNLTAENFYKLVNARNIDAKIDHITISHFNFRNELVGRFSGSVLNQGTAMELLEQYKADIVKISFLVTINPAELFTLQLFPNGVLKFLSEIEESDFIIDYLKQLIFTDNG